ncbi:MAG: imidazole glycerol phosphate synthase subunit HisF [Paenibacillaceae bacterium]|jgi:cyclase|nr:imidazole glycerol phosphate synthase subunit HisF [Paenibacillaceae bacterium]
MITKRIVPCLDVKEGRVVKGVQFLSLQDAGDPVALAARYDEEGADELVFLDISASHEGRKTMVEVVAQTAGSLMIPFTVGGGISTTDDMRALLRAGADKISINTAAVLDPTLITRGAMQFGAQCIVVAIDARWCADEQTWIVVTHGGRRKTALRALEWAEQCVQCGAGELLVTSMDRDGTKEGYDIALTRAVAARVAVPVIASGGAGCVAHVRDVLTIGQADAALAASIFHYAQSSIGVVKNVLREEGVHVR